MDRNLKLTESVSIRAPRAAVWEALTDRETIEKFMWGTHATSEWHVGSPITFEGVYQGKAYRDKGTILEIEKGKKIKYSFLSGTSEDKPENYAIITYALSGDGSRTLLSVTQEGAKDQQALEHSRQGWQSILENLRKVLEDRLARQEIE